MKKVKIQKILLFCLLIVVGFGLCSLCFEKDILQVQASSFLVECEDSIIYSDIGETVNITVKANCENVKYRWYYSKDEGESWKKCQYGITYLTKSLSFDVASYQYGYQFKCLVTNEYGQTAWSDTVTLLPVSIILKTHPKSVEQEVGTVVSFSVEAVGNNLSYVWEYSADKGNTWSEYQGDGYDTSEIRFNVQKEQFGNLYRCVVSNDEGKKVVSHTATLERSDFEIVKQPQSGKYVLGDITEFIVETEGIVDTYQWEYSKDNGVSWSDCFYEGNKSNKLMFEVQSYRYGYLFRCKIRSQGGKITYSDAVELQQAIGITQQASVVVNETTAEFKIAARGVKLSYEWVVSEDKGKTWELSSFQGRRTSTMTISELQEEHFEYQYKCIISDNAGNSIESNVVELGEIPEGKYHVTVKRENQIGKDFMPECARILTFDEFCANASNSVMQPAVQVGMNCEIKNSDVVLIRVCAKAETECGKIEITVNGGDYVGSYALPVSETEYILPISGFDSIDSVKVRLISEPQNVVLSCFEIINCGRVEVPSLKTGIFNLEQSEANVIDISEGIGYSATDIATYGNYLYAIHKGTLAVYNVEKPERPMLIGTVDGLGNCREIAVFREGTFLAVSARENGVYFVNVENPSKPFVVSKIESIGFATGIYVEDDFCFVCNRYYGVEVYDLRDINNPGFVTQIVPQGNLEMYDCYVESSYLYISCWAQKSILIYSLDNVYEPKFVSEISLNGNSGGLVVENGILYVATGYHSRDNRQNVTDSGYGYGNGLEIWDISNPEKPIWLSTSNIDGRYYYSSFDHWKVAVSGEYAYLLSVMNGLYVFDVSKPNSPVRVDKAVINIPSNSALFKPLNENDNYVFTFDTKNNGQATMTGCVVKDGYVYVSSQEGNTLVLKDGSNTAGAATGLYAVPMSVAKDNSKRAEEKLNGKAPDASLKSEAISEKARVYKNIGTIFAIARYGEYYYCAAGVEGIKVFDKTFSFVDSYRTQGAARDIKIINDYMVVAESDKGMGIYTLNAAGIEEISHCSIEKYNEACTYIMAFDEKHVLVQYGWTQYAVVSIANPYQPVVELLRTTGTMYGHNLSSGLVNGACLAVTDKSYLTWFTSSNNGVKELSKLKNTLYQEDGGIAAYGGYAIMTCDKGYYYYNPSTISEESMEKLELIMVPGVKKLKGEPVVSGDIMIVSNSCGREIIVVDVSDIENPILMNRFEVNGNPGIASSDGKIALIPLGHGGVLELETE